MLRFLAFALVLAFASNAAACDDEGAHSALSLRSIAAGTDVQDRKLIGANSTFKIGAPVWVHIAVRNPGEADEVTMVWRLEDELVWEMKLDVGTSSAWRTWTRMRMPASRTGQWTVEVLDTDGESLGEVSFDVVGGEKAPAPKKATPSTPAPKTDAAPAEEAPPPETAALIDDEPGC